MSVYVCQQTVSCIEDDEFTCLIELINKQNINLTEEEEEEVLASSSFEEEEEALASSY